MIEISTARWWTDKGYYSTWAERLSVDEQDAGAKGLELEIEADRRFIEATTHSLTSTEEVFRSPEDLPARGYEGVIEITLNGEVVNTSVMSRFAHREPWLIWEGEYLGNGCGSRTARGPASTGTGRPWRTTRLRAGSRTTSRSGRGRRSI